MIRSGLLFVTVISAMVLGPQGAGAEIRIATAGPMTGDYAWPGVRFRAHGYEPLGYTLYAYAAVQIWAQAVELAGSLDLDVVTKVMHSRQFDTVLGRISFDRKGDVTGFEPWSWYVWQADGTYVPME
jgi:branched-chain amino acid transport system substrate-binding protein